MHSEQLEAGVRLVEDLSRSVAALYAQITPFRPQADTASKLLRCADVFEHLATGFAVVAGRAGGAGTFFRALGAHATDASAAHDPCALLALVEPSLFTVTPMFVERVEPGCVDGRVRGAVDGASPIGVVTDLGPEAVHAAFLIALGCP